MKSNLKLIITILVLIIGFGCSSKKEVKEDN